MAANKPQGNQSSIDPMLVAVIIFLIIVVGSILWGRFHTQIATAYAWLRMAEFFPFWTIGEIIPPLSTPFHDWFSFFWESDKSLITWSHLVGSSLLANIFTFVFVILPVAVWMARKSLATNPYNHKHFGKVKDYTLHSFTDAMGAYYPHLRLFRKLNLTQRSINAGKYRMADTEKQFAIKHELLDRVKGNDFKVNRDRSVDVFREQLGKLWTGYGALTRSEYAIIAALIPRLAATDETMSEAEYKEALGTTDKLISGYWESAANSYDKSKDRLRIDLTAAKKSVQKYGKHPKVLKIIKAHAYVSTIIYAMLSEARTLGVLAACDMRWLRVTDRRTWLLFDNVGRIVSFAEVSGIYSHYLHEQRQRRAIEKPQVDAAVKALIEAVDSFKFTEREIDEINQRLNAKELAEKAVIDMKAVEKSRKTVVLAVGQVGTGANIDMLEAALLSEGGEVLFEARCKPSVEIDDASRQAYGLDDPALAQIAQLPESSKVKEKLLEICNGQRVVVFDELAASIVSGLGRSASEMAVCASMLGDGMGKGTAYDAAALLQLSMPAASKKSAVEEARACREIWVEIQKRALRAQQGKEPPK